MTGKKKTALKPQRNKSFIVWKYLKRYLLNASIHGVGYLVEDNRHWTEKCFWLMACGMSWWGCGILISDTISDFMSHKVDITMETNYLNWEIEFPALHFCFYFSNDAKLYAAKVTGTDQRKATTMARLTKWQTMGYESSIKTDISSDEFLTIGELSKPECKDIFGKCEWNDEDVDCCEMFIPMETNLGQCLSFNSIHTNRTKNSNLPKFVMNHYKQMARITIYFNQTKFWNTSRDYFTMLLTNVIDYPSRSLGKESYLSVQWTKPKPTIWDFDLTPTHNDNGITSMEYHTRRCRFPWEINDFYFLKVYNYHGCVVEAQMKRCQSYCGCVSHLYPSSKIYRTCNLTELACVFKHRKEIIDVIDDDCLPECEETKIKLFSSISPDDSDIPHWAVTKLMFNLLPGPYIRYSRYTVHSLLDVIIAVGSTLGLFVGASILSVFELFYWFFLRCDNVE